MSLPRDYQAVSQNPEKPIPLCTVVDHSGNSNTERDLEHRGCLEEALMGDGLSKQHLYVIAGVVGVAAALLVILLPMSFSTLEFHQYGFVKRKSTARVNVDKVYTGGRYAIGPDYEFKKFRADAHFEEFNKVTVFAADRLQVSITANMQYFLRQNQLALLHKNFDIHYEPVLRNNALDALKGAATVFTTREYIRERMKVEEQLFKAVKERLGGKCCEENCEADNSCVPGCLDPSRCVESDYGLFAEVRYFQLAELEIPRDLEERYLEALVLQEETEAEKFKQEAQIVRKETDAMVKDIENEAEEITQNANSQSSFIDSTAQANATAIVEGARTKGLKHLYSEVGLTQAEHKNSFDYLRTMMEKENIKLAVDYQTNIAGPPQP